MKNLISIIFSSCIFIASISAQELNQRVFDEKSKTDILIGLCDRDGLLTTDFVDNYNDEYAKYEIDKKIINELKETVKGVKCVIVLGTWCDDSKKQLPRFLKIVDIIGNPFEEIKMIALDRDKKAPEMEVHDQYSIEKVPTFIFYHGDKEIGRIIETPAESLENDLLQIVTIK